DTHTIRKYFQEFKKEDIIIGTPYAFHSTFYIDSKGRTKSYYDLVKHRYSKGYNIYVTDIFKIWMNDAEKTESDRFFLGEEVLKSSETLLKELEIINPKSLIAFGDLVEKSLSNLGLSTIKLPHPSGANRNWNKIIQGKSTCEEKVKYLCSKIDELLNECKL
ncbi:MAG: uracil-DNA glycosylase family protein, partial [Paludibacter sp.]